MKKFDVMFSADKKYIDIMLSSIYSLLLNSNLEHIRIHIIASNFTMEDYKKIEAFITKFSNVELYFYPFEFYNIEKYKIPSWRGVQISNARLFFEDIIKPHSLNIKNLLYLDSDTITVSDLTELQNYQNGLFASKDGCLRSQIKNFPNIHTYYNSGVIYINVEEWLEKAYQERIIKFIENSKIQMNFPDQDIFNCALAEQIKELPIDYNLSPHAYTFTNFFSKLYFNSKYRNIGYEEITEAKKHPKIIHSYGYSGIKPWHGDFNPYCEEYMKYITTINPNFNPEELDEFKKLLLNFPHLYKAMLFMRTYLPENIEKQVKKLALKCQQSNKKDQK